MKWYVRDTLWKWYVWEYVLDVVNMKRKAIGEHLEINRLVRTLWSRLELEYFMTTVGYSDDMEFITCRTVCNR